LTAGASKRAGGDGSNEGLMERIIWQYWETRGTKPAYIDGLHEIAVKNAGVPIVRVTPETIHSYLPDLPDSIHDIGELAHKADMIRALLLRDHGGMWLDADAIVLGDLNRFFDHLDDREFIGFNDSTSAKVGTAKVRICCFLSRPRGRIVSEWVRLQHAKFPRIAYDWTEVGSDLLHPLCVRWPDLAEILPFESIMPIPWFECERYSSRRFRTSELTGILEHCSIVMLASKALSDRKSAIQDQTIEEIAGNSTLMSHIVRKALDADYVPPKYLGRLMENVTGHSRWTRTRGQFATRAVSA
jgi:hypothetical protein